ncbi:MAG: hypothetical protein HOM01_04285, partial [Kordiimonadaceae bacterium]|nr:hypothetical protein [Kordiimonadaceae bacterium]
MKKITTTLAVFMVSTIAVDTAFAQDSDFTISGDVTGISDYRFRGVSMTNKDPAVQGTLSVEHKSGLYVTAWGTNISDFNGAKTEFDFMAG